MRSSSEQNPEVTLRKAPNSVRFPSDRACGWSDRVAFWFAANHALSIYPARSVYSFIPKNACTTLRYSIARANGFFDEPSEFGYLGHANHLFRATIGELSLAEYTFVFLRCPFRRLASAFLDKSITEAWRFNALYTAHFANKAAPARLSEKVLRKIRGGQWLDKKRTTFRHFVEALTIPGALGCEHHWVPQSAFLIYKSYSDYFCLEDAVNSFRRLEERLSMPILDTRELSLHGTDRLEHEERGCFADTPVGTIEDMRKEGRMPAHVALYDEELVRKVSKLYESDISIYSQKFPRANLLFPGVVQ